MVIYRIKSLSEKPIPVYIECISEEQEKQIDNSKMYYGEIIHRLEDDTIIPAKNIYLYGKIEFTNEDINLIKEFDLINSDGEWIYSNFDYDKGCYTTIDKEHKTYPTYDAVKWFKYCHCLIGKPNRIIVYKLPLKNKKK